MDATECWLLPLLYDDNHAAKITGCMKAANYALKTQNKPPLEKADSKQLSVYRDLSKEFRRRRTLMKVSQRNPSLKLFIERLDASGMRSQR